jgi:hypothetical protein
MNDQGGVSGSFQRGRDALRELIDVRAMQGGEVHGVRSIANGGN